MSATRSSQACYTRVTCTFNLLRLGQITEAQELLSGCYEVPCKAFEVVPAGLVLQLLTRRSLTVAKIVLCSPTQKVLFIGMVYFKTNLRTFPKPLSQLVRETRLPDRRKYQYVSWWGVR